MSATKIDFSFDEWVAFIFSHPVQEKPWYSDKDLYEFWDAWSESFSPEKQLSYVIKLFENAPKFLNDVYSIEQIDEGLGMIFGGASDFALNGLIWDPKISWLLRKDCINSIVVLFKTLFAKDSCEFSCWMCWDILREWDFTENQDPKTKDAIFTALAEIIKIPSRDCQMSALHGFNHMQHPDKAQVIQSFLENNSSLDEEIKNYATWAIDGGMM